MKKMTRKFRKYLTWPTESRLRSHRLAADVEECVLPYQTQKYGWQWTIFESFMMRRLWMTSKLFRRRRQNDFFGDEFVYGARVSIGSEDNCLFVLVCRVTFSALGCQLSSRCVFLLSSSLLSISSCFYSLSLIVAAAHIFTKLHPSSCPCLDRFWYLFGFLHQVQPNYVIAFPHPYASLWPVPTALPLLSLFLHLINFAIILIVLSFLLQQFERSSNCSSFLLFFIFDFPLWNRGLGVSAHRFIDFFYFLLVLQICKPFS
ncbi:hypothetical protein BJ742DRAFT_875488 [Cladochytrium replicatum]|nr:hypothetical protein BJ742DRAFT_875488 [Cladochytrium replicatum]